MVGFAYRRYSVKNSFFSKRKAHLASWQPKTDLTVKNGIFFGVSSVMKVLKDTKCKPTCSQIDLQGINTDRSLGLHGGTVV